MGYSRTFVELPGDGYLATYVHVCPTRVDPSILIIVTMRKNSMLSGMHEKYTATVAEVLWLPPCIEVGLESR